MKVYDNHGSLLVDYGLHAAEHESGGGDELTLGDLVGSITDAQHGSRTQANAHAHSHLSGIGASDHHTKYTDNEALAQADASRADNSKTIRIEARTSDPASPSNGEIWLRTDL